MPNAPTFYPTLSYADARAAIDWLSRAFGFTLKVAYDAPDGSVAHAEMTFGDGMVMFGSKKNQPAWLQPGLQSIYVHVADADAHYARAKAAGARIVREIEDTNYGSREYTACDPDGHFWHFGTYRPEVDRG